MGSAVMVTPRPSQYYIGHTDIPNFVWYSVAKCRQLPTVVASQFFETSRCIKHEKKHDNSKPKAKNLTKVICSHVPELTLSTYSFQCFKNFQVLIIDDSSEIFCCKNAKEGQPLLTITEL